MSRLWYLGVGWSAGLAGMMLIFAGWPIETAPAVRAGLGLAVLWAGHVLGSTLARTAKWYGRGSATDFYCPDCNRQFWRVKGDWIAHCYRCGYRPGWPIVRWVTRSLPVRQLWKAALSPAVIVLFVSATLVGMGLTGTAPAVEFDADDRPGSETPPAGPGGGTGGQTGLGNDDVTDTDNDGIADSVEQQRVSTDGRQLPGADPRHKDLYISIVVAANQDPLTNRELEALRWAFARMNVSNPDGSTGINVHVTQRQRDRSLAMATEADFDRLRDRIYPQLIDRYGGACTTYVVLLGTITEQNITGYGSIPGHLSVVDATARNRGQGNVSERVQSIVHEVLHNVVGRFGDGTSHTSEGWLANSGGYLSEDNYLSNKSARTLSTRGFARSEYYQQEFC